MINYFVTENFIKTRTQVSQNVDFDDIAPNIRVAAIDYIRPILGKEFFDDLLEKYNNQTLNSDEEELVEIIQMIVAYRAVDATIPFVTFRISNKGVSALNGEFSTSEGLNVINYLRNELKQAASTKEDELKNFLKLRADDFPIYKSKTNKEIVEPQDPYDETGFDII